MYGSKSDHQVLRDSITVSGIKALYVYDSNVVCYNSGYACFRKPYVRKVSLRNKSTIWHSSVFNSNYGHRSYENSMSSKYDSNVLCYNSGYACFRKPYVRKVSLRNKSTIWHSSVFNSNYGHRSYENSMSSKYDSNVLCYNEVMHALRSHTYVRFHYVINLQYGIYCL